MNEEDVFRIEVVERLTHIETLVSDVPELRKRIRQLELGFVALVVSIGGLEILGKVYSFAL